ncbi:hypothetical protein BDA96_03G200800 [Sorghum bicolor]|uniref:Uncharacterized protein n=2 Tax=Sorghum bicolor TaxID=4558 RepID=A0A921RFP7_SORBI|nr:hypothetical protein BDA96_03G200800 [Sorghum bicolor]OQU86997.1 hypothetical protein SORBI_3003G185250 [Sorghum bicolor]
MHGRPAGISTGDGSNLRTCTYAYPSPLPLPARRPHPLRRGFLLAAASCSSFSSISPGFLPQPPFQLSRPFLAAHARRVSVRCPSWRATLWGLLLWLPLFSPVLAVFWFRRLFSFWTEAFLGIMGLQVLQRKSLPVGVVRAICMQTQSQIYMKLELTLVSEIYVIWCLRRPTHCDY